MYNNERWITYIFVRSPFILIINKIIVSREKENKYMHMASMKYRRARQSFVT